MFDFAYFTSISSWAMLQAAPSPTASGVGTVPERSPLSCPPPFCIGSKRTLGLRRTYNAPTPGHTHVVSIFAFTPFDVYLFKDNQTPTLTAD